jgi:hypothetical protein
MSLVGSNGRKAKALFLTTLAFSVTFLSVVSPLANDDSPLFTHDVLRTSFTIEEVQAASIINGVYAGEITTDDFYGVAVFNSTLNRLSLPSDRLTAVTTMMLEGDKQVSGLVVIRTSALSHPVFILTGGTYVEGVYSPYFYILRTYNTVFVERQISSGNVLYSSRLIVAVMSPP